jgi:hypothetical protein
VDYFDERRRDERVLIVACEVNERECCSSTMAHSRVMISFGRTLSLLYDELLPPLRHLSDLQRLFKKEKEPSSEEQKKAVQCQFLPVLLLILELWMLARKCVASFLRFVMPPPAFCRMMTMMMPTAKENL